jgi:hypothetical protein
MEEGRPEPRQRRVTGWLVGSPGEIRSSDGCRRFEPQHRRRSHREKRTPRRAGSRREPGERRLRPGRRFHALGSAEPQFEWYPIGGCRARRVERSPEFVRTRRTDQELGRPVDG